MAADQVPVEPLAQKRVVLGIGNPLLDISAHVPETFLEEYKLSSNVPVLAEPHHMPIYGRLVRDFPVQYIAGGATQNSIRVAQWMLGKEPATTYLGCVGKDDYAQHLREEAAKCGMHVAYMEDEATPTGTCAALITGKHRALVANIAAASKFHPSHLDKPDVWSLVEEAQLYYMAGFFLTSSPESALRIAQHASEKNKVFALNLAAPFICEFFTAPLMACTPFSDIIFGNETEAAAFGKSQGWEDTDVSAIALRITQLPKANSARPRLAIITQGADDVLIAHEGAIRAVPVTRLPSDYIIDTNGAGDAFVGGFLSRFVQGKSLETCVRAGLHASKVVLGHSGCTYPAECDFVDEE